MKKINIKDFLNLIPYDTIIFNKNYERDYVNIKYSAINGVYPLYIRDEMCKSWHYTTNSNSTGVSLSDGLPVLRRLPTITRDMVEELYPHLNIMDYNDLFGPLGNLSYLNLAKLAEDNLDNTNALLRAIHVDTADLIMNDLALDYNDLSDDDKEIWQLELVKATAFK